MTPGIYTQEEFDALAPREQATLLYQGDTTCIERTPEGLILVTQNTWPGTCGQPDHAEECDCVALIDVYSSLDEARTDYPNELPGKETQS